MPKSKHRKKPFRTAVQERRREHVKDKQAEARRAIYDRALPIHQPYPPHKTAEKPREVINQSIPSRIERFIDYSTLHTGSKFELSNHALYEMQEDGSVRRLNKQPSKANRLRAT